MGCGISHPDPVAYRRGILPHTLIKYNSQIDSFSLNQCLWIMPENLEKETSKISFNFQLLLILKYEKNMHMKIPYNLKQRILQLNYKL